MQYSKKKIITMAIILAFVGMACVFCYSAYLMNSNVISLGEPDNGIDIYDMKLQYDLGIAADNYEQREVYTQAHYDVDKKNLIKYVQNKRFDMIVELAQNRLAQYQFNDEKLELLSTLEHAEILESNNINDKILFMSKIKDPELYILTFLTLRQEEQSSLVEYDNVNILPAFVYEKISCEIKQSKKTDPHANIIGCREYYSITLQYKHVTYVVDMVLDGSFSIFYVNNVEGTIDSFKYT
jgi:hypothetical protein